MKRILVLLLSFLLSHVASKACDYGSSCYTYTETNGVVSSITITYVFPCTASTTTWIKFPSSGWIPSTTANNNQVTYDVSSLNMSVNDVRFQCITVSVSTDNGITMLAQNDIICPCPGDTVTPCDANFKYCFNSTSPNVITISQTNLYPWITGQEVSFYSGMTPQIITSYPYSYTYPGTSGSYQITLFNYFEHSIYKVCSTKVDICINMPNTENPSPGQLGKSKGEEIATVNDLSADVFDLKLHPNPATSKATLSFSLGNTSLVEIQILDALGRVVKNVLQGNMAYGLHNVQLETGELSTGMYIVKLRTNSGTVSQRLSVIK